MRGLTALILACCLSACTGGHDCARQQILAGHFSNTRDNLASWIERPQQMLPGDAMPDMGLTHAQAHAIADYLYTLD